MATIVRGTAYSASWASLCVPAKSSRRSTSTTRRCWPPQASSASGSASGAHIAVMQGHHQWRLHLHRRPVQRRRNRQARLAHWHCRRPDAAAGQPACATPTAPHIIPNSRDCDRLKSLARLRRRRSQHRHRRQRGLRPRHHAAPGDRKGTSSPRKPPERCDHDRPDRQWHRQHKRSRADLLRQRQGADQPERRKFCGPSAPGSSTSFKREKISHWASTPQTYSCCRPLNKTQRRHQHSGPSSGS